MYFWACHEKMCTSRLAHHQHNPIWLEKCILFYLFHSNLVRWSSIAKVEKNYNVSFGYDYGVLIKIVYYNFFFRTIFSVLFKTQSFFVSFSMEWNDINYVWWAIWFLYALNVGVVVVLLKFRFCSAWENNYSIRCTYIVSIYLSNQWKEIEILIELYGLAVVSHTLNDIHNW